MKRSQKKTAGTATVEAVIMLPVLILLFLGLGYVARLFGATLDVTDRSRRCVQLHAMLACEDEDSLPPECRGLLHQTDQAPPEPQGAAAALLEARADVGVQDAESRASDLSDVLDGLLGGGMLATATGTVSKPKIVGDTDTLVRATSYATCNTKPAHANTLAKTLFEKIP